ncbi:MAG: hypothetical protein NWR09_02785, partial [Pseudomonadales bacterium]|nr:hypothetical protein [Pseudomonadales bacterium]
AGDVAGDGDAAGIYFEHLSLRINSLISLLEGNLVVSQLAIDRLALQLVQDSSGHWQLAGLPASNKPFAVDPLLASMAHLKSLDLTEVDIDVLGQRARYHITNQPGRKFELSADGDVKFMSLPLLVQAPGDKPYSDSFELLGRYRGDPRLADEFDASLYIQLPRIELLDLLPARQLGAVRPTTMDVSGEFWLTYDRDGFELLGVTSTDTMAAQVNGQVVPLFKDLQTKFSLVRHNQQELQLYFAELDAEVAGKRLALDGLTLLRRQLNDDATVGLTLPRLSISAVAEGLQELGEATGLLPLGVLNALQEMQPAGELGQIHASIEHSATVPDIKLVARLDGISIAPAGGIPGISRLDGLVSLGPKQGFLDMHNTAPFNLDFAAMFAKSWSFDTAHARLQYTLGANGLAVSSGLINVTEGQLVAAGRVQLRLPADRAEHTWGLEVGLRHADLREANRYLPEVLTPALRQWLGNAILAGNAREGGLLFHGALFRDAPKIRKVHELYFDVAETRLQYDPAWPVLNDIAATVYINNSVVESEAATATLLASQVSQANVLVPMAADGGADTILIDGNIKGDFSDGIKLLTDTPIADLTRQMAAGWVGQGPMAGSLNLNVPIGDRTGAPIQLKAVIGLAGSDLHMPNVNLEVKDIVGDFVYATGPGLSARGFSSKIFNEPVQTTIQSTLDASGGLQEVTIVSDGVVAAEDLYHWSQQALLSRARGKLAYQAILHVPAGQSSASLSLQASSDLQGVVIDLPRPMGKTADESLAFDYRQIFQDSGDEINLGLGELVSATLQSRNGVLVGGRIHYGSSPVGVVTFDKLRVTGELETVNYQLWQNLLAELESKTALSLSSEVALSLDSVDLHIRHLDVLGFGLDEVSTRITRAPTAWQVALANDLLAGTVSLADDSTQPLVISLDYLHFASATAGADPLSGPLSGPLSDIDPRALVAVDFATKNLMVGELDYGSWAFNYRPSELGGRLSQLTASVRGLEIDQHSSIDWQVTEAAQSSHFVGVIRVPDLARALKLWGYASSIQGNDFFFDSDLSWPGTPAMIDVGLMTGHVKLNAGKGRFVQAEARAGALKLLGIFDFASLARRFRFDFSDIVDQGFSFNKIEGGARFNRGIVDVVEPIVIEGAGSNFRVGGRVNLNTGMLDNDMIVTLPVSRNLPWYAAYSALTNPLIGAGVFIAQKLFEDQIDQMASAKYEVSGTLDAPQIKFISIFNDSIRDTPAASVP